MSTRVTDRRHRLWLAGLLATAGVGLMGAVQGLGWDRAVIAAIVTSALGATIGLAWIDDAECGKHPVLWGAALTLVGGLGLPGLFLALGVWAAAAIGLLGVTSPWVTQPLGARWFRMVRPSPQWEQVAIGHDALLREWATLTWELAHSRTPRERVGVVEARAGILDDILGRNNGRIPDFVWWSVDEPHARRDRPGR